MTLRLPMSLAASLLLASHAAYASPAARRSGALACQGLTDAERRAGAFVRPESIDDVRALRERPFAAGRSNAFLVLRGAVVSVRPEAGLTAERLQQIVDCHLAEASAVGYQVPGMKECPLALRGAAAVVRFDGAHLLVEIRAGEGQAAAEVWRRALQMQFATR